MSYFVFISDSCKKQVHHHGVEETVTKLKSRIEREQSISFFENFPTPFIKKKVAWNLRLVASVKLIQGTEDVIIIFHRVLTRGGEDYKSFIAAPRDYGNNTFQGDWDEQVLRLWLADERKRIRPPEKKLLTESEVRFIWHASQSDKKGFSPLENEPFIYESAEWVRSYPANKERYGYETIRNTLVKNLTEKVLNEGGCKLFPVSNNESIAVRIIPNLKVIFIFSIIEVLPGREVIISPDLLRLWEQTDVESDDFFRSSLRAYPYFLLIDDRWSEIQESSSTNLALSPEEKEVLLGALSTARDSFTGFPLFLNGRAGSGKSTLLQYLFAEFVSTYLEMEDSGISSPLYMSYSPQLITIAKKTVIDLLQLGHRFNNIDIEKLKELESTVRPIFLTFSAFLRNMVPEESKERFSDSHHVSYSKFVSRYNERFRSEPKFLAEVNGDLCWHVIRTFIKGYNWEDYLDENDYEELGKARSVSSETFQRVYNKVWNGWYKDLTVGAQAQAWDDLDLVRFLLNQNLVEPRYSTIFCDEAQDFTQIELDLLYRSSIYSDRQITLEELKKVPLAFAGDQFQTLNPTGFKWGSIRASYTEKFISSLVPWETSKTPMLHYRELQYNYRSQSNIVKLCNSLQLLRKKIFDIDGIVPQKCWQTMEREMPQLVVEHPKAGEYIKDNLGVRIIVPCNLGEEEAYFNGESFLLDFAPRIDGFPLTVESAMRAKGQEYDEVIVYGFGKKYVEKKFPSLVRLRDESHSPETLLELEYFFNKLYVALSRSKKKLFIIDSEESRNVFWKYFLDGRLFEDFVPELILDPAYEDWQSLCGLLIESSPGDMILDAVEPEVLARQKEEEGIRKQDAFLLRQAAGLYSQVQYVSKAAYCNGIACELKDDYSVAGDYFQKCGEYERAFNCYWRANDYKKASLVAALDEGLRYRPQSKFARFAVNPTTDDFVNVCVTFAEKGKDLVSLREFTEDDRYSKIIDQALKEFLLDTQIDIDAWNRIFFARKTLTDTGLMAACVDLAKAALKAGFAEDSVALFVEHGDTSSQDYRRAKEVLLQKKLEDGNFGDIITEDKGIAIEILLKKGTNLDLAAKYLLEKQKAEGKFKPSEFERLFQNAKLEHLEGIAYSYFRCLVAVAHYSAVFKLIGRNADKNPSLPGFVFKVFRGNERHWSIEFVKVLATSDELVKQSNSDQNKVIQFLRTLFIDTSKEEEWQLHPLVVGAAFERAGLYVASDQYYEKVLKRNDLPYGLGKELSIRKLKVLSRLVERSNEPEKKSRYQQDMKELSVNFKIDIDPEDIPAYPVLGEVYLDWRPNVKSETKLQDSSYANANGILETDISTDISTSDKSIEMSTPAIDTEIMKANVTELHDNEGSAESSTDFINKTSKDEYVAANPPTKSGIPSCVLKLGDFQLEIDRRNKKIKLQHTEKNAEAKYNFNISKWNCDDDVIFSTDKGDSFFFEDWDIKGTFLDDKTMNMEFRQLRISIIVNGME